MHKIVQAVCLLTMKQLILSNCCPSLKNGLASICRLYFNGCHLAWELGTSCYTGAETAQSVEHLTERPGAKLTPVRFPSVARDFSPSQLSVQTLTVSVQPPCACSNICMHVTNPKHWLPYYCLDTEILHAVIGEGSTVLAAAVPYLGTVTWISPKGWWTTTTKNKNKTRRRRKFLVFMYRVKLVCLVCVVAWRPTARKTCTDPAAKSSVYLIPESQLSTWKGKKSSLLLMADVFNFNMACLRFIHLSDRIIGLVSVILSQRAKQRLRVRGDWGAGGGTSP